ncbi:hypothetical protein ACIBQ1_50245 [Nonomuraea sp. NPDC050153]|uniref:hypothetical protein n=1 Tax=Nonomuraea sp. NPDC050153 TaxID=3364359 RepID=UPI0037AB787E
MSIRRTGGRVGKALVVLSLVLTGTMATTGQASASPANCSSWPSPAGATNKSIGAEVRLDAQNSGHAGYVALSFGTLKNNRRAGWARLTGSYEVGYKFWFDVSSTRGNGWIQCGPFTYVTEKPNYTPAHYTSADPNLVFRACGKSPYYPQSQCTGWY